MSYSEDFIVLIRGTYTSLKSHSLTAETLDVDENIVWAVNIGYELGLSLNSIRGCLENVRRDMSIVEVKTTMRKGRRRK